MDCDKASYRMHHYLDGELAIWRRWTIRRHIQRCPPCADGFVYEVEFRQVIATRCRDAMPDDLRRRIAGALGCEQGETQRSAGRTAGSAQRSRPEQEEAQ
ncbi:MAG: zf-HC2 domain-containing protein [Acidimicrobiia bacterium]